VRLLPSLWDEFFEEPWPRVGVVRWAERQMRGLGERGARWAPPVEILDSPEAVVLVMEVPGVRPEDIEIEVQEDVLTVRGEKPLAPQEAEQRYLRIECPYGPFERSFALGMVVEAESVTANYQDGLLRLRIRKARRQASRVKVKVE